MDGTGIPLRITLTVAASAIGCAGLVALARFTRNRHQMSGTKDVEQAYIAAVSTLYGIFVAFMIFTVYQRYNEAREDIAAEANAVATVYRLAEALPRPLRDPIQAVSVQYANSVARDEWPAMRRGETSARTEAIVGDMWRRLSRLDASTGLDVVNDHLLQSWTDAADLRRTRILRSGTGLSEYSYAVLIIGALITIGFASIFTVDNIWLHMLKAASLTAMICLMLVTIWALDHPFHGQLQLQPDPFIKAMGIVRH